jgi:hypothetical protein
MKEGAMSQGMQVPSQRLKRQGNRSLLHSELPEGTDLANTLILSLKGILQTSDLWNCKIII